MAKITLDVDNKDKDVVLMILKNLKSGLIKDIKVDNKSLQGSSMTRKVQKPVLEDEFLPKATPTSAGKYLSKDAFKAKIQNKGK